MLTHFSLLGPIFFDILTRLRSSCVFSMIFFDFWWSGEGFGKDFGRIFEGFSMLLAEFIEKSIFAKIVILPR